MTTELRKGNEVRTKKERERGRDEGHTLCTSTVATCR